MSDRVTASRAEEVMRRYLTEVLGERKFELIPDFVADDMVDHTQTIRGPAALDAHARGFCAKIPDVEIEVVQIIATDDAAVGVWRWRGTPNEPMGVSASGGPIYPTWLPASFNPASGCWWTTGRSWTRWRSGHRSRPDNGSSSPFIGTGTIVTINASPPDLTGSSVYYVDRPRSVR